MDTQKQQGYQGLIVWQKSMQLAEHVYALTKLYPKEEIYSLIDQMRRSAVSIPSNIAEGYHRGTRKEYRNFLHIAYGSGAELQTQLILGKRLGYGAIASYAIVEALLEEVLKMLNTLIRKLS